MELHRAGVPGAHPQHSRQRAATRSVTSRLRDVSYNPSALELIFSLRDVYRQTTAGRRPLVLFWTAQAADGIRLQAFYNGDTSSYFEWVYDPKTRKLAKLPELPNHCTIL